MKQKITVVLSRTRWEGDYNIWTEHKTVDIEIYNPELGKNDYARWHVVGELQQEGAEVTDEQVQGGR